MLDVTEKLDLLYLDNVVLFIFEGLCLISNRDGHLESFALLS